MNHIASVTCLALVCWALVSHGSCGLLESLNKSQIIEYCKRSSSIEARLEELGINKHCAGKSKKFWVTKLNKRKKGLNLPSWKVDALRYGVNLHRVITLAESIIYHMKAAKVETFNCPSRKIKHRRHCNATYEPQNIQDLEIFSKAQLIKLLGQPVDFKLPTNIKKISSIKHLRKKLRFCKNCQSGGKTKGTKKRKTFVNKDNWNKRACSLMAQIDKRALKCFCSNFV